MSQAIISTTDPTNPHKLKPCPFCGGANLEIANTHTPSFWVECQDCGAEVSGNYVEVAPGDPVNHFGYRAQPNGSSQSETNYKGLHPAYKQAFDSAVDAWNRRPGDDLTEDKRREQLTLLARKLSHIHSPKAYYSTSGPDEAWFEDGSIDITLGDETIYVNGRTNTHLADIISHTLNHSQDIATAIELYLASLKS